MKNPLYVPGLKPGIHRIGQGSVRKVRIRDIVSTQALVDESKIKKLARFTKNMPGTPTLSHRGRGKYSILDGNHRVNAALRQGKRTIEALVQKFSSKQPIIHFISCTTESVPRVDLSRRIVKKRIDPIRRLSARLDRLIQFALPRDDKGNIIHRPGISRDVLHGTVFTQDEVGKELFNAATSRGTPTDAGGESRIIPQPGGRKLIKITEGEHLRRIQNHPGVGKFTPEELANGTPRSSPEIRAGDLRNEPKLKGVVRRSMEADAAPKLAEEAAKQTTQAGKERIYKEGKAAVGEELKPQNIRRKLDDTRMAIAQTARTRHEVGAAVSKKYSGLNRTEHQNIVESAHENLTGHLRQALESRKAQGHALHADILKQTHEALVKADKRYSPTMHKRDLEKLRIAHESNAHELMKATFGGGAENKNIDVNAHSRIVGRNLHPERRQYHNLINTPYEGGATKTKSGRGHVKGSPFKYLQRQIIKSGKIFEGVPEAATKIPEVKTNLTKFPLFKGAGIAAGLVGGGLIAHKLLKKKEEPQKQLMSSRIRLIQFGKVKGSRTLRKILDLRAAKNYDKTMGRLEHEASGGSQWTAPEHRGGVQSVDYSKHAIGNEDEIRREARLKERAALPPDAPHSLHPNAKTYQEEAEHHAQSASSWKAKAEGLEKRIAESIDPVMRRAGEDPYLKAGTAASEKIGRYKKAMKRVAGLSDARVRKATARVMGARRAALGRQAEVHAGEMEGARSRMIRNTAIGVGGGFIAGAALTGNDSHQPKRKELKFSADLVQDAITAAKSFNLYHGGKPLRFIKKMRREVERRAPILYHPAATAAKFGQLPIPGSATAGAAVGLAKGAALQIRRKESAAATMARLSNRPPVRMSGKGDILRFDVSQLQKIRNQIRPNKDPSAAHDIATGGLEGSVGSLAFLPVEHRIMKGTWKNPLLDEAGKFSKGALGKRLAIGGAIGAVATGLVGAGVSAISKKRKDSEPVFSRKGRLIQFFTLREAVAAPFVIGGAGAGIGAGIGAIRRRSGDKDANPSKSAWRGARIGAAIPIGMLGGAITGEGMSNRTVLAGGAIAGLGAAYLTRKRKEQQMSSRLNPIQFEDIPRLPASRAVTKDRYIKKIHENDMDRAESGYLRTGLGGAAIGAMLSKGARGRGALIGAGTGAAAQLATRLYTGKTKDQFGDRSYAGKRIDRAPSQIAGLAALGLAGKGISNKLSAAKIAASKWGQRAKVAGLAGLGIWGASKLFSRKGSVIQFARDDENPEFLAWKKGVDANKAEASDWRKSKTIVNKATQHVKRGHRLLKDVVSAAKGQKNLDSRGRERKREWDKPWVRNVVTAGIGATSLAVFHKAMRGTGPGSGIKNIVERVHDGRAAEAISRKFPPFKAVHATYKKFRGQAADEAASASEGILQKGSNWIDKNSTPIPKSTADLAGAERRSAEAAAKRRKGILKGDPKSILEYRSKSPVIRFQWEQRQEGDQVKLAKIRRRIRAEKPFYKKENFENSVTIPVIAGGSFISGGLAAQLYNRRTKTEVPKTSPTPGGGAPHIPHAESVPFMNQADKTNIIRGVFREGKKAAKKANHLSVIERDPLIHLQSRISFLLN